MVDYLRKPESIGVDLAVPRPLTCRLFCPPCWKDYSWDWPFPISWRISLSARASACPALVWMEGLHQNGLGITGRGRDQVLPPTAADWVVCHRTSLGVVVPTDWAGRLRIFRQADHFCLVWEVVYHGCPLPSHTLSPLSPFRYSIYLVLLSTIILSQPLGSFLFL